MRAWRHLPLLSALLVGLLPTKALAHCPLCTLGAGAAAIGAGWLGVDKIAIGVFLGAFAAALGLWAAKLVHRQLIPFQRWVILGLVVVSTILPLTPLLTYYTSVYVRLGGGYGTIGNRTYLINLFLVGCLLGVAIMLAMPSLSQRVTRWRHGRLLPYQGITLTLALLLMTAGALQVWL